MPSTLVRDPQLAAVRADRDAVPAWLPTLIGLPAVSVATSIGWTVPSPKLVTHTVLPSGVAATSAAILPTGIVATTGWSTVSMTVTLFVLLFATNSLAVRRDHLPSGPLPTGMAGPALSVRCPPA